MQSLIIFHLLQIVSVICMLNIIKPRYEMAQAWALRILGISMIFSLFSPNIYRFSVYSVHLPKGHHCANDAWCICEIHVQSALRRHLAWVACIEYNLTLREWQKKYKNLFFTYDNNALVLWYKIVDFIHNTSFLEEFFRFLFCWFFVSSLT